MPGGGTGPVFRRSGSTDLFWSSDPDFVRRLAFLSSGALAGDQASLVQTWADLTGVYVFFEATQPDTSRDAVLEQALRKFLAWMGWPAFGQRMLWLHAASGTGDPNPFAMNGPTIDTVTRAGSSVLRRGTDFDFAGYVVGCAAARCCPHA